MRRCLLPMLSIVVNARNPWPMYGQNPTHSRTELAAPALRNTSLGWAYRGSSNAIYGSPAVGENDAIYFASWDGHLYSLNPDGSLRWKFLLKTRDKIWSSPALAPCTPSTANCSDPTVYVGGNESMVAVGQQDGKPLLHWSVPTRSAIFSSPTLDGDGSVFFGGLDGTFRAIAPNGTAIWQFSSGGPIYASAALSDTAVFFATMKGRVIALAKGTGKLIWAVTPSHSPITSSPSVSPDGTSVYFAGQDGHLRAFSAADGTAQWNVDVGFVDGSSPAVSDDGTVYIGSLDKHLYAVDATGKLRWRFEADSQVQSSPAIGAGGLLFFNSYKATMYALDLASGTAIWSAPLGAPSFSSPALGERGVYVGTSDGRAIGFKAA